MALVFAALLACVGCRAPTGDLILQNVSGQVIDGGSFARVLIRDSRDITLRNVTLRANEDAVVLIEDSDDIRVEHSDIDGAGTACTGIRIEGGSRGVEIVGNRIHNLADDGIEAHGARNLLVAGNVITRLLAFGTDSNPPGPCYNGHSDGIEIFDVADSQFIGNLVYDVRSTAAVFFGNWADSPAEYCRNVRFENNVFLTPESGFVGYLSDADGVVLVNNVFWRGIYGGIVVGKNVTGLDVANNVLHSVNYHHSREPFVPEEHRFRHNLLATTEAQQTPPIVGKDGNFVTGDPGFAGIPAIDGFSDPTAYRQPAAAYPQSEKEASNEAEATEAVSAEPETPRVRLEDFAPKPGSPLLDAGSGAGAPTKDALGRARPRGKGVDIGAFEGALAPAR